MSSFILIFFDDSTELAGDLLPAGKQTRAASSHTARVAPIPQSKAEVSKPVTPAPIKTIADYRPHCLNKDACAGSGLRHCYQCSKPIPAESEVA